MLNSKIINLHIMHLNNIIIYELCLEYYGIVLSLDSMGDIYFYFYVTFKGELLVKFQGMFL